MSSRLFSGDLFKRESQPQDSVAQAVTSLGKSVDTSQESSPGHELADLP